MYHTCATVLRKEREGDVPGTSQKTCKTKVEKLSIRGKWAVRKWFKIIFIYSMSGRTKVLLVCAVSLGASILRLSAQEVGGDTITGESASDRESDSDSTQVAQ